MAFAWTFPTYILVAITERGTMAFSGPDNRLAIFTDIDAADRFRDTLDIQFTVLPIRSAPSLKAFLRDIEPQYQAVIVDYNRDTKFGRAFSFPAIQTSLSNSD